jgi:putative Holliday junction resolvase
MRTLAIDLGARRVGLALSDAGGTLATPFDVLTVRNVDQAIEPILRVIAAEGVERIVVGVPLNMDNSVGRAARSAAAWGRALAQRAGKPLVLIDERLSSFEAGEQLSQRRRQGEKLTRAGKKKRLDAIAAAAFLQQFLDGAAAPLPPDLK